MWCGSAWRCSSISPIQPGHLELARCAAYHLRCREKRIVIAPELLFPEIRYPLGHDCANFIAHWEKERVEGFAEFCSDLARILIDTADNQVNMLDLHGSDGAVPRARQQRECDKGAVAALNIRTGRHRGNDVLDLFQCGRFLLPPGRGDARVLA